jgi:hypothetical protein
MKSRATRVRCSAKGRFAQNESEIPESNESLAGCGCRTDHELALHRAISDLTSSHIKHLAVPTVKRGSGWANAFVRAAWTVARLPRLLVNLANFHADYNLPGGTRHLGSSRPNSTPDRLCDLVHPSCAVGAAKPSRRTRRGAQTRHRNTFSSCHLGRLMPLIRAVPKSLAKRLQI